MLFTLLYRNILCNLLVIDHHAFEEKIIKYIICRESKSLLGSILSDVSLYAIFLVSKRYQERILTVQRGMSAWRPSRLNPGYIMYRNRYIRGGCYLIYRRFSYSNCSVGAGKNSKHSPDVQRHFK